MKYHKCKECGQRIEIDYFNLISKLKKEYYDCYGFEATHLIISMDQYFDLENSQGLIDRLKYVKDTSNPLGSYILGLKIVKTSDIDGLAVVTL